MIVEPDFLDHWKTRLLCDLTASETAPLCVLRLWAHCQHRRQWAWPTDGMTPDILKAVCRFQGDGQIFWDAMTKTFLDLENGAVSVHDWEKVNASLIGRWKGGQITAARPQPPAKPRAKLPAKPIAQPPAQLPAAGEREEESREEEIGEEKKRVGGNGNCVGSSLDSINELKGLLADMFKRKNRALWNQTEEMLMAELVRRPDWKDELDELKAYRELEPKYFPGSLFSLLDGWDRTLDRARNHYEEPSMFAVKP